MEQHSASHRIGHSSISHSMAHHLVAVAELTEGRGYARVTDISRRLALTRGSVSVAMQSLRAGEYVEQDENHFFRLTAKGTRTVASIRARHRVVEEFLTEVLALPEEAAHRESCRVEYLLEAETTRRLMAMVAFWRRQKKAKPRMRLPVEPGCPDCSRDDDQLCPCCGLECLEGQCQVEAMQP